MESMIPRDAVSVSTDCTGGGAVGILTMHLCFRGVTDARPYQTAQVANGNFSALAHQHDLLYTF
eukprot:m.99480 g.99480  ORF g.99480 m.99480 type:complete len:64 (+) comp12464_c0_seq1:94-285(+)